MASILGGLFKQSPKRRILLGITLISLVFVLIIKKTSNQDLIKQELKQDSFFAIYINDEKTTHFPSKEEKLVFDEEKSYCNNGVNINWSYLLWTANIEFQNYEIQNKERTCCNLYFKIREEYTFDYTGDYQEFVVPKNGYYQMELWGARGNNQIQYLGESLYSDEENGGGAYTRGTIYLESEEKYNIYVGGMTGYNGGGIISTVGEELEGTSYGGGATDIRLNQEIIEKENMLASRIMVAAGGGTASYGGRGGAGGTLKGQDGIPTTNSSYTGQISIGYGGTQTSGGKEGFHNWWSSAPTSGKFGFGGNGENDYGGCGGGGYYGGGGAGINQSGKAGGGGGSSYISGYPGCIAITSETNQTPKVQTYTKIEDSYHYSGKIFTNGVMIAGDEEMPTYNEEETMVGNRGNGYARITYLGK